MGCCVPSCPAAACAVDSWASVRAASTCADMDRTLPEVEEREDEHPDEVDEVPVQAGDLDDLVTLALIVAAPDLERDDRQVDHPACHVQAVEPGDHEKARAE